MEGFPFTGSTQGIGFGVLRGLASAGADVVMHGLIGPQEFEAKVGSMQEEFGVKVGHSSADVRNPGEIRQATHKICLRTPFSHRLGYCKSDLH